MRKGKPMFAAVCFFTAAVLNAVVLYMDTAAGVKLNSGGSVARILSIVLFAAAAVNELRIWLKLRREGKEN